MTPASCAECRRLVDAIQLQHPSRGQRAGFTRWHYACKSCGWQAHGADTPDEAREVARRTGRLLFTMAGG